MGNNEKLLEQRKDSAKQTESRLHQALDRFEQDSLLRLEKGSTLTVRNLAIEAEVSKDTPLSKYKKTQLNSGECRFPSVVSRFNLIKDQSVPKQSSLSSKDQKLRKLKDTIETKDDEIRKLAIAINKIDAENIKLRNRNNELEEANIKLRRESMKVISLNRIKV